MTGLYGIAYVSNETRKLLPVEIDALLMDARNFNALLNVTGVLFYGDGRFFQLLQGSKVSVERVMARVSNARSHKEIKILQEGPIFGRAFDSWHMGFVRASTSTIQALSQAAWEDAIPHTREDFQKSEGIGLLMFYWNKWASDPEKSVP